MTEGEEILVAEEDGTPLGFSAVWTPDRFLHHFFIHPGAHRSGIGRVLIQATLERHGPALSLKCAVRNTPARAFYRAMGWIETDEPGGDNPVTGPWIWLRTPALAAELGLA